MQRTAENPKQHADDERTYKPTPVDPREVLRAATSVEGMPVEWLFDRLQAREGYPQ